MNPLCPHPSGQMTGGCGVGWACERYPYTMGNRLLIWFDG